MPDYFAHLRFGQRVYEALEEPLRARLALSWDGFCCGLYGPDPLLFYRPLGRNSAHLEGVDLHGASPLPVLNRYRRAVQEGEPVGTAYAAGFLCHYVLDSRCHPYIYARSTGGDLTHLAIEAEFDRFLMARQGIDGCRCAPMPKPPMGEEFLTAVSAGYQFAGPKDMGGALRNFYRVARLLAALHGTAVRGLVNGAAGVVPGLASVRGMVLGKEPEGPARESNQTLLSLLEGAVDFGAAQVEEFFAGVAERRPWRIQAELDFKGNPLR